ncbi:MAG TPA: acyltransferase [Bacteroidia bacterium]|nr:acyltransferase [Bacteroidia bacterium]
MGLIRLLLAFSVVIAHSTPIFGNRLIGGETSVRAFFIISGFYMALVLNEKYTQANSYKLFITNRLLRLYPLYWVMLLLTICLGFAASHFSNHHPILLRPYFNYHGSISVGSWIYLILTNIALVGQDWIMFMGFNPTHGNFFFSEVRTDTWQFLVVPQSWSVGVEIVFYLIAPFVVRKKSVYLLILIALSLLLRFILFKAGYSNDPWLYRFFPTELGFFLIGSLVYKFYFFLKSKAVSSIVNYGLLALLIAYTICYQSIPLAVFYKESLYYLLIAIATPVLFLFTKNNKWDNWIGELTYPVYMCHIFVFVVLGYLNKFTGIGNNYSGLVTVMGSVVCSIVLVKLIVEPIEKIRQRRVKNT